MHVFDTVFGAKIHGQSPNCSVYFCTDLSAKIGVSTHFYLYSKWTFFFGNTFWKPRISGRTPIFGNCRATWRPPAGCAQTMHDQPGGIPPSLLVRTRAGGRGGSGPLRFNRTNMYGSNMNTSITIQVSVIHMSYFCSTTSLDSTLPHLTSGMAVLVLVALPGDLVLVFPTVPSHEEPKPFGTLEFRNTKRCSTILRRRLQTRKVQSQRSYKFW